MKQRLSTKTTERFGRNPVAPAFTLVEVLVVLATLALLVMLLIPALGRAKTKANRISCVSCLKNHGLALRIFATDNQGLFPFQISTNGIVGTNRNSSIGRGTLEYAHDAANAWRHWALLSNELSTPKILICPADKERIVAPNFRQLTNNGFLSYTLGLSGREEDPQSILSGDRNLLLDGAPLSNVVVSFRSNANVAFDRRIHVEVGNLLLGDGSVQQVTSGRLRDQFRDAFQAAGTNTLVIP